MSLPNGLKHEKLKKDMVCLFCDTPQRKGWEVVTDGEDVICLDCVDKHNAEMEATSEIL